ncbi:hypothetical protein ACH5RR_036042 [Cinchona calisaya]|uniref:F-box domain-containing protein n=1 Tax=Cinchona calisaya TaxID=153742 RepID=A0ABD2Y397_9GENT
METAENLLLTPCDRISDLPSNVIESILMYLPTRDAARTSILSRKWRYKWTTVPQIILDDTIWDTSNEHRSIPKGKFVKAVFQILLIHQGPIFKFVLSIIEVEGCPEIDSLMINLSRSNVKELTLKLCLGEHYKMPSSFFSCQELRQLNLRSCLIAPPASFKGFSQLISLTLHKADISAEVLESLISSCLILEKLKLEISDNLYYLEISAPKLKSFIIKSPVRHIFFKNTPILAMVSLVTSKNVEGFDIPEVGEGIIQHFDCLSSLENLHLDYYFIKSFSADGIPTRITTALIHLKVLKLTNISLDIIDEVSFVLFLLRCSPNLREMDIKVYADDETIERDTGEILDLLDNLDITFNELQEVKLHYISATRTEMELIKLLLGRSPFLGKMVLELVDEFYKAENEILKKLNTYRRASRYAEVVTYYHNESYP